ncbi:MAG TPA: PKD domain-containing protein [Candidatus Saccharimonadales bacterium]|nr:PKD domain-containing protein [Candidatus Saccharimonadales bacterium]
MSQAKKIRRVLTGGLLTTLSLMAAAAPALAVTTQSGSTGVSGTVPGPAPAQAATIDIPANGQSFSTTPITVSGFCPSDTLVEIYKNNVFSGSAQCQSGSYTLQVDLFDGRNDLVAKVFDSLNQQGPDSKTVTVNFSSAIPIGGPRITLTTQYAKRGADPGSILTWPTTLTGGTGPYAFSIDWGDKTTPDLISRPAPGNIDLQHTYTLAGVYKVTVKATDVKGNSAFLQLVGIANGPVQQAGTNSKNSIITSQKTKVLIWPVLVLFALLLLSYWLGLRHQLEAIRNRLSKGDAPF